jgi:NAD+ kinase
LTSFNVQNYETDIKNALRGDFLITLRTRFCSKIIRKNGDVETNHPHVLNEIVIDRGISTSLTHIELYCNSK